MFIERTQALPAGIIQGSLTSIDNPTAGAKGLPEAPVPIDFGTYLHRIAQYQKSLPPWLRTKDKALVITPEGQEIIAHTVEEADVVTSESLARRRGGSWQTNYVVRLVDYHMLSMLTAKLHRNRKLPQDRDLLPYGLYREGLDGQLLVAVSGNPLYGGSIDNVDPTDAEDYVSCGIFADEPSFTTVKTNDYIATLRANPPTARTLENPGFTEVAG